MMVVLDRGNCVVSLNCGQEWWQISKKNLEQEQTSCCRSHGVVGVLHPRKLWAPKKLVSRHKEQPPVLTGSLCLAIGLTVKSSLQTGLALSSIQTPSRPEMLLVSSIRHNVLRDGVIVENVVGNYVSSSSGSG